MRRRNRWRARLVSHLDDRGYAHGDGGSGTSGLMFSRMEALSVIRPSVLRVGSGSGILVSQR